ncbi:phosphatidylinositol-glycan biosynthesis class W protein-like [Diadema antillarum]|uniref:phosphatidylinositol-glycan biosynthesis class W protein-like n=1 Tax=Diadema antillarum TaxID=105358 RepID=UPI003A8879C2
MAGNSAAMELSKEMFYSNLNGTTKSEVSLMLTVSPSSVLLRSSVHLVLVAFSIHEGLLIQFLLDFLILTLPLCLSATLLSDSALQIVLTEIVLSVSLILLACQSKCFKRKTVSVQSILETPMCGRLPFITNFRVLFNVGVAVGILAVDFVVFPRRFAKTETFGTGIMDGGVGAYVLMNAIVSPEARGKYDRSGLKSVMKSVKSSVPLLILGFGRLASLKGIDYHENVSEYGVHWNFFFTLAATKVLCTLLLAVLPPTWSGLISLSLALLYQHLLTGCGLQEVVLHGTDLKDSRAGFFNANREGLASCLGYVAIYFAGVKLGQYLMQPRSCVKNWLKAFLILILADALVWLVLLWVEEHVSATSRRLANMPYIIWNIASGIYALCCFLLIDIIFKVINHHIHQDNKKEGTSLLVSAVGRNQLLYFLLANLMTGLVNISIDTIRQPNLVAFFIICVYMLSLNVIMVFLHVKNVNTKFW